MGGQGVLAVCPSLATGQEACLREVLLYPTLPRPCGWEFTHCSVATLGELAGSQSVLRVWSLKEASRFRLCYNLGRGYCLLVPSVVLSAGG